MQHYRTRTFIAAATILTIAAMLRAEWNIDEKTDEMTDEKSYFVSCRGSMVAEADMIGYRPALVLKVMPKKKTDTGAMLYNGDLMFMVETDAFRRNHDEIALRFNRDKPVVETWDTSTDRHALFAPDWKTTLRKLSASTNLTVRYVTTLGHVRTTRFETAGLTNTLRQVKKRYLKEMNQ